MDQEHYFIAITAGDGGYEVHFVNGTSEKVKSLEMSGGGFVTFDDDPVTLSSFDKSFGEVEPFQYLRIDSLSPYDLDCVNSYELKITTETGQVTGHHFFIGPRIGFMGNKLPIINKYGRRIILK